MLTRSIGMLRYVTESFQSSGCPVTDSFREPLPRHSESYNPVIPDIDPESSPQKGLRVQHSP